MNSTEFFLADAIEAIDEVLSSGGEFHIYPRGTSMLPIIKQGRDSVVLRRNSKRPAQKYDIVLYRRENGQFVLHRVLNVEKDGTYVMCGDNQTKIEHGIKGEQIVGYVSEIYRNGKPIRMETNWYPFYVSLWCKMPLRKFFLFIGRVKNKIVRITKRIFGKRS